MLKTKNILLVYPQMGISGAYVCHMPLSLLYTAIDSIKEHFEIAIVDVRLSLDSWQRDIASKITADTILVGISVITGAPVKNALAISRWIKDKFPNVKTVWGGPHASFNGHEILFEKSVDYVINGYGSLPLARLAKNLRDDTDALPWHAIPGLIFRKPGTDEVLSPPPENTFERVDYRDIPYILIEDNLHRYGQFDSAERIFSMYSTMGCPHNCAFCSSPALLATMENRYKLLPPQEVVDHIEHVYRKYHATYIYFIDDDSFVSLGHVEAIIDEIRRRSIAVKLGFRGARVNEIQRMDDAYLTKLARSGTNIMHIGAESGSQRMLDFMNKNITIEDILDVNRKLAKHAEITAGYNWVIGLPGETLDDLAQTRNLILRLLRENPSAFVFPPNKYRPLPGTELYKAALRAGYRKTDNIEDCIDVEVEGDYTFPWYSEQFTRMVNMMQVTSYFIDNKLNTLTTAKTLKYFLIKMISRLYKPIALLRYRYGLSSFLIEYKIYNYLVRYLRR